MPEFEFDPYNGNRIKRSQLRTNPGTGERLLVDEYHPRSGAKWDKPIRVLRPLEKWPPEPVPVATQAAQKPSESEERRKEILAWLEHGDPE